MGRWRGTRLGGVRAMRRCVQIPPAYDTVVIRCQCFFAVLTQKAELSVLVVFGYFIFIYKAPFSTMRSRQANNQSTAGW